MQFSLKWLFVLVGFVGVSCFALMNATPAAHELLRSSAVLVLFVSVLGAVFRNGSARAFCVGFALFGFGNLVMNLPVFGTGEEGGGGGLNVVRPNERLGEFVWHFAHREYTRHDAVAAGWITNETSPNFDTFLAATFNSAGQTVYAFPEQDAFNRVFGTISTCILALLGGLIAQALYLREQRKGPKD